jgi:(p)ppGpp synthase/HD superfamily hydrolase
MRHNGQLYPGSDLPYVIHIAEVVFSLQAGLDADPDLDADLAVVSAILHDTVEDTGASYEVILEAFGKEAADGVLALSKTKGLTKSEAMTDSLKRIREQPKEIWAVKLADRITNLCPELPLHHWTKEKCLAYAEEGGAILAALGEASPVLAAILADRIAVWNEALAGL